MSSMPGGDFNSRLQAALAKAKTSAPASGSVVASPEPAPGSSDAFSERLRQALNRDAPGGAAASQTPGWHFREVGRGETLATIAAAAGVTENDIWQNPGNDDLREDYSAASEVGEGEFVYAPEPIDDEPDAQPAGQGDHIVRVGDCMSSIARDTGFFWQTLWDHAANSELKAARSDPNVLLPDDRLTIPEKQRKDESITAETRNRFVRRGEPAFFNATICVADVPVTGAPYQVLVDHRQVGSGVTSAAGSIDEVAIPGNAREALVIINPDTPDETVYRFALGHLPTVKSLIGVQARLASLGFECQQTGRLDSRTVTAITEFQKHAGLPLSGRPDTETRTALEEGHGS